MARRVTTTAQRLAALKVLQHNDYNYAKTSKETGFSHNTLHAWQDKYGAKLDSDKNLREIAKSCEVAMNKLYTQFFRAQYGRAEQALQAAIDKGVQLLETEKDLNRVSQFARVLLDYGKALGLQQGEGAAEQRDSALASIQQTVIMLNSNAAVRHIEMQQAEDAEEVAE